MTCEQIRKHVEEIAQLGDAEFWSDSRVAVHLATCADCGQLAQERQILGKSLQLLRESVAPVPESVDAAVRAGYRRYRAEWDARPPAHFGKVHFPLLLRWGAVAALVLIGAVIGLFSTRKAITTSAAPSPGQSASTTASVMPQTGTAQTPIRPAKPVVAPKRKHSAPSEVAPAMRAVAPIPDEFRGLMYCDELSCNGAMDLIRVQLPSSVLARPASAFRQISGAVNADVIIGPDGIARGIRIEEREF